MIPTICWELKQRRTAIIWWCLGSALLTAGILSLYPSIRNQAHQLNQVINQLPQGLRELKTGGSSSVDIANPIAFLNSQLFYATLPIVWIILAITRGSAILGRDEQNHTLELLLARPISRGSILAAKGISLLVEFTCVSMTAISVIALLAPLFSLHVGTGRLVATTVYTALFSLSFGAIAFMLQAASSLTRRAATTAAVLIGLGGYLLASLSGLTDWLKVPAKLVPYHYFTPDTILHGNHVHGLDAYLIGIYILTAVVSYIGFRRRDIE
jgi:ABC-2 type transport system permease protein